jgi:hypothetical protein
VVGPPIAIAMLAVAVTGPVAAKVSTQGPTPGKAEYERGRR